MQGYTSPLAFEAMYSPRLEWECSHAMCDGADSEKDQVLPGMWKQLKSEYSRGQMWLHKECLKKKESVSDFDC